MHYICMYTHKHTHTHTHTHKHTHTHTHTKGETIFFQFTLSCARAWPI